jgi:membrane associated rhomboid family serine protease
MEDLLIWLVVLGATTGAVPMLRTRRARLRLPPATLALAAGTLAVSTWGNLDPGILDALRRDRALLRDGEWWRLVTPLVVQDGGWPGTVFNLAILLLLGATVETLFGWRVLTGVYLSAGLASEIAAYTVMQHQGYAGNSVAVMGLAGLLVASYLGVQPPQARVAGAIGLVGGIGLIATANLHGAGFAVGVLAGVALVARRRPRARR